MTLSNVLESRVFLISRLVAEHFVKKPKGTYEVNHLDGNIENNYYKNLEWTNKSGNALHSYNVLGNHRYSLRKLNDEDIREIRSDKNHTQRQLSKMFGVAQSQIWRIIHEKVYKEVN